MNDEDQIALGHRQRQIAREFPAGEYVVLVGDEVVAHTPNRGDAFTAYDQACGGGRVAVIVPPDARQTPPPAVFRGRVLSGQP